MPDNNISFIPEQNPGRLGRHIEHDERSLAYPAPRGAAGYVMHDPSVILPYDQGQLGSCTGNAMAGLLMTDPFLKPERLLTESDAVELYHLATTLDAFPGEYPPEDTGSSGLAAAKAAVEKGYINSYGHAFGLEHTLDALVLAPVIVGVNWYSSFDNPSDPDGYVRITKSAYVRGGHEFLIYGYDPSANRIYAMNSWGLGWGDHGRFNFSRRTLRRLLSEGGDVTTVLS